MANILSHEIFYKKNVNFHENCVFIKKKKTQKQNSQSLVYQDNLIAFN